MAETDPTSTLDGASTLERAKQIEINRLKGRPPPFDNYLSSVDSHCSAKARQRQQEQEASSSTSRSYPNGNNKRPIGVTSATSNSPTAPRPLTRDSRLGNYYDYDLSKMVNSKGGFLVEEGKEVDEKMIRKEKEREQQRTMQKLDPREYECLHLRRKRWDP